MKKYILPLVAIVLLSITSCNEESTNEAVDTASTTAKEEATKTMDNGAEKATEIKNEVINNTPAAVVNTTSLEVDRMVHDFGTLSESKPVSTKFTITNTGNNPLVISQTKGSCGCTVPTKPEGPIAPGESGEIEVSFNPSGKAGAQNKTVTIIANTEPASTVINIKSVVDLKDQPAAPKAQ